MINGISFTGRETMLTAGLKNPQVKEAAKAAVDFFKADAPHGGAETVAETATRLSRTNNLESYKAAHQPILTNPIARNSAVTGENLHFFG